MRKSGHLHGAAAFMAGFDVNVEHAFEALTPGHRCPPFAGRLRFIRHPDRVALAPFRWGDQGAKLAPAECSAIQGEAVD